MMPPSLPPHAELVRRVLLGVEVCIVLLATIHSAHATITAGRLQSLQCAVHGDCATEPPQGEEVVRYAMPAARLRFHDLVSWPSLLTETIVY